MSRGGLPWWAVVGNESVKRESRLEVTAQVRYHLKLTLAGGTLSDENHMSQQRVCAKRTTFYPKHSSRALLPDLLLLRGGHCPRGLLGANAAGGAGLGERRGCCQQVRFHKLVQRCPNNVSQDRLFHAPRVEVKLETSMVILNQSAPPIIFLGFHQSPRTQHFKLCDASFDNNSSQIVQSLPLCGGISVGPLQERLHLGGELLQSLSVLCPRAMRMTNLSRLTKNLA